MAQAEALGVLRLDLTRPAHREVPARDLLPRLGRPVEVQPGIDLPLPPLPELPVGEDLRHQPGLEVLLA